jgi:thioredoxin reductase
MKKERKEIAIIGGGASGLMSAILCARAGLDVIEQQACQKDPYLGKQKSILEYYKYKIK